VEESYTAGWLIYKLWEFNDSRNLGGITGEEGKYVLFPKLARPGSGIISCRDFPEENHRKRGIRRYP